VIGLDTNLLVRYFIQDDALQSQQAGSLLETHSTPETPGFITVIVICELIWVLGRRLVLASVSCSSVSSCFSG